MPATFSSNTRMESVVTAVSRTARDAMEDAWLACRAISWMEMLSSSAAAATVWTLFIASSDAAATVVTCSLVWAALVDMRRELPRIAWSAAASPSSTLTTVNSNSWIKASSCFCFRSFASASILCASINSRAWISPFLKTSTVWAMAPISSVRVTAGISTSVEPSDNRVITPRSSANGRTTERVTRSAAPTTTIRTMPKIPAAEAPYAGTRH